MTKRILTQEELKEQFHYDPETGVFTRIASQYRTDRINAEAGSMHKKGYIDIKVNRVLYKAHRLAWLYIHGAWPDGEVDHINGIRHDNRLCNLRDVDKSGNQQNQRKARADNKCGYLGVSYHKLVKKYASNIRVNKVRHFLGWFDCPEAAHEAYLVAKRNLHKTCAI
jgi:hypothetical protein